MSQRMGMADGRNFTINSASGLYNNYIMEKNGVAVVDNYSYRKLLQSKGPALIEETQNTQTTTGGKVDKALVDTRNIY